MKKFKVAVVMKAVVTEYYEVEANSAMSALDKANKGNVGKFIDSSTEVEHGKEILKIVRR
jgi:hypothetical protein